MIAIDEFIEKLEIGEPFCFENIVVSKVYGDDLFTEQVRFVDDAIQTGQFRVNETGVVHALEVENALSNRIFIACGTLLEGGRQNRQVSYPALVAEGDDGNPTKTRIATQCIQHGRWHYNEERPMNTDFVTQTRIMKADARSGSPDQHKTWCTIAFSNREFGINNGTKDYANIVDQIPIEEYKSTFKACEKRQLGHIVAVRNNEQKSGKSGDVFFYSDIFGNHRIFEKHYDSLVQSVAVVAKEAMGYHLKMERNYLENFLKELRESEIKKEESYKGVGELYLAARRKVDNEVKGIDGSLLHATDIVPVQYSLRKDIYVCTVEHETETEVSPNLTLVMDGRKIRQRLDEMNNR